MAATGAEREGAGGAISSPRDAGATKRCPEGQGDSGRAEKRLPRGTVALALALLLAAPFAAAQPPALPPRPAPWMEAIVGEYGEGRARLVLREENGALQVGPDGRTFEAVREIPGNLFEADGLGVFRVDRGVPARRTGKTGVQSVVQGISVGRAFLARRDFGGSEGVFRIEPLRPVAELQREAGALAPPEEAGEFLPADLVDVRSKDKSIRLDVRYATTANFLAARVYGKAQVRLQRPAAEALVRAHRALKSLGYGLLLHDGYRPWFVTWIFWNATPEAAREFVADPGKGSRHNRGCAIDLTLFDLKTKEAVDMPGLYDEMSPRSYPDYQGGTSRQRALRDLLRRTMEREGFAVYENEWWHFDYKDWPRYAISNQSWWKN